MASIVRASCRSCQNDGPIRACSPRQSALLDGMPQRLDHVNLVNAIRCLFSSGWQWNPGLCGARKPAEFFFAQDQRTELGVRGVILDLQHARVAPIVVLGGAIVAITRDAVLADGETRKRLR